MRRRQEKPRVAGSFAGEATGAGNGVVFVDPEEPVHGREVAPQGLPVANHEAPEHEQLEVRLLVLERHVVGDHGERLAARRVDETTRVDEHDVGLFRRCADPRPRGRESRQEPLGVHKVLRAAEAGEMDSDGSWFPARVRHGSHHTVRSWSAPWPRGG